MLIYQLKEALNDFIIQVKKYEDVDEDLMEDFIKQKERIVEMFDRFKKFI